jgi:hypothetical protein
MSVLDTVTVVSVHQFTVSSPPSPCMVMVMKDELIVCVLPEYRIGIAWVWLGLLEYHLGINGKVENSPRLRVGCRKPGLSFGGF